MTDIRAIGRRTAAEEYLPERETENDHRDGDNETYHFGFSDCTTGLCFTSFFIFLIQMVRGIGRSKPTSAIGSGQAVL